MGWCSGSRLMQTILNEVKDEITIQNYEAIINAFEEFDCDTLDECIGFSKNFDAAYRNLHPEDIDAELYQMWPKL